MTAPTTISAWLVRRAPDLVVLAGFLALALYVSGGMLLHPGNELATNGSDVGLLSWLLQHDAYALAHGGHGLLVTHDLNAPDGVNVMWNTALLLPGILLAPLTWLTDGRATFAVLLWLAPALSAFSAYVCLGVSIRGRALISGRGPRAAAGLIFGFSPALVAQSLGHLQMVLLMFVPVLLLLLVEAVAGERRARTVGAAVGLTAAAQLLTGEEVLFITALAGLVVTVALALSRPRMVTRERLQRLGVITALAVAITFAIGAVPLLVQFFGPHHAHGSPFTRDYFKLDVAAFTTPTPLQELSTAASRATSEVFRGGPEERGGYLGWPLVAFAAVLLAAGWRDLRVRIPVLTAAVLSLLALGAHPLVHGTAHDSVTLPWGWLIDLPFFETTVVSRLALLTALLLGVAVAAGLERISARSTAAAVAVAALVITPLTPVALKTEPVAEAPAFFADGARVVPQGRVLVLAPPAQYGNVDAMRWQAAADFRFALAGGYFIGTNYDGRAVFGPQPRTLLQLLGEIADRGFIDQLTQRMRDDVRVDLEYYDAWGVAVGPMSHRAEAEALVTELLGQPPILVGGVSLWRLAP